MKDDAVWSAVQRALDERRDWAEDEQVLAALQAHPEALAEVIAVEARLDRLADPGFRTPAARSGPWPWVGVGAAAAILLWVWVAFPRPTPSLPPDHPPPSNVIVHRSSLTQTTIRPGSRDRGDHRAATTRVRTGLAPQLAVLRHQPPFSPRSIR